MLLLLGLVPALACEDGWTENKATGKCYKYTPFFATHCDCADACGEGAALIGISLTKGGEGETGRSAGRPDFGQCVFGCFGDNICQKRPAEPFFIPEKELDFRQ